MTYDGGSTSADFVVLGVLAAVLATVVAANVQLWRQCVLLPPLAHARYPT
jgi:hypothetical protein